MYHQCRLRRESPHFSWCELVSYLPAKYAVVGKFLELRDSHGVWVNGWEVLQVGAAVSEPPDYRQLIKGHREMTGDSLPKCLGEQK